MFRELTIFNAATPPGRAGQRVAQAPVRYDGLVVRKGSLIRRVVLAVTRFGFVGVLYGLFNHLASQYQVFTGVSMVFFASAVGVAAAMVWRWETAAAVFAATLLTPWSADNPVWLMLLYSLGNTVEAVLPALVLRPRQTSSDLGAFGRILLWACLVNTLLNVLIARGWRVVGELSPLAWEHLSPMLAWCLADAMAIAVFALPVVLRLRPELFFREANMLTWSFLGSRSRMATVVVLTIAVSWLIYVHDMSFTGSFNWPVLLYLVPLNLLLVEGGLPGIATSNAVIVLAYLTTLGFESVAQGRGPLHSVENLMVVYGNLTFFLLFTVVAGTISSRRNWLFCQAERRWRKLQETFEATVRALAAAIEAKDEYTEQHLDRVSRNAEEIARRLGLPSQEVELIRYGAILHDVGKIAVPAHILAKRGKLTPEEAEVVERHLEVGARILERAGSLEEIVPLVKYHEERWDGRTTGPYRGRFGLSGKDIPLGARIIAVADAYDAMTSDRPYRGARDVRDAVDELKREAGKQFDPEIVRLFLRILKEQGAYEGEASGFHLRLGDARSVPDVL